MSSPELAPTPSSPRAPTSERAGGEAGAKRATPASGARASSPQPAAISFQDVTYSYPDARDAAIEDITLAIGDGELCLLAGMTGQGKSSILRAACGLVPHFHGGSFAGRVTLEGRDTREHGPAELGALVGVLFQDPETQLVMSTVRAELALGLEARGWHAAAVARAVEEVALALGIDHLLDRPTTEMSGGEKQRVALGAALAGGPRVALLDEPTSQLDPVAGDELISLLRRLNRDWGLTVVLAEHRIERCLSDVDRVICVHAGRIAFDGDPAAFQRYAASSAPDLQTPGSRMFSLAGLPEAPTGVREARAALHAHGLIAASPTEVAGKHSSGSAAGGRRGRVDGLLFGRTARSRGAGARAGAHEGPAGAGARRDHGATGRPPALRLRAVWLEIANGPSVLRGIDLTVHPGERIALMGRNGSGKSTLLRLCANLVGATRGSVQRAGEVALLLQNPGDYLLRERVSQEVSGAAHADAGLQAGADRNPRDLSGGERQRLALAIVTDRASAPAVLALDEPTRGMDRRAKATLADSLRHRAQDGQAIVVATHDPEFAAACAERVLMLADGRIIADAPAAELLSGGWYFATEVARILGRPQAGRGAALLPEQGAAVLRCAGQARETRSSWGEGRASAERAAGGRGPGR
ncbi:MAG: ABC transporter ATP-binding protein [Acidobacteriota bacterium]|nr:ABC transporter ATP-binding protein [Acidobacteriota bacterium]